MARKIQKKTPQFQVKTSDQSCGVNNEDNKIAIIRVPDDELKNKNSDASATTTSTSAPSSTKKRKRFTLGYRFCPTDQELIKFILKKLKGQNVCSREIHNVDIYKHHPQDLAVDYTPAGRNEWYFFTPRDRKYRGGDRPRRDTGNGYWKATGADTPIIYKDNTIGYRMSLVFYQGKPREGIKTCWIMHEYKPNRPPRNIPKTDLTDMLLDTCILCRIYQKVESSAKKLKKEIEAAPHVQDIPPASQALQMQDDSNNNNIAHAADNENSLIEHFNDTDYKTFFEEGIGPLAFDTYPLSTTFDDLGTHNVGLKIENTSGHMNLSSSTTNQDPASSTHKEGFLNTFPDLKATKS